MGAKILLIDDDAELVDMIKEYLEREDFAVTVVHDGETGVREALSGHHALVVLDVMMPGIGGIEVLRRIREASAMPVLMLTARGDDTDRIVGLELGADDYVPKPCMARELTARIRAILKRTVRSTESVSHCLSVGALKLWPEQRRVEWQDRPLGLTSTEFSLLEVLMRNAGTTVSKAELSEQAIGRPLSRFDRSIDVHMSSIRQKLGSLPNGRSFIQTVIRKGYLLVRED